MVFVGTSWLGLLGFYRSKCISNKTDIKIRASGKALNLLGS